MKKQRNMAVAALALIDETFGAEADNKAPSSEQASDTPTAGDISAEISTEAHLAGGREGIKTALVLRSYAFISKNPVSVSPNKMVFCVFSSLHFIASSIAPLIA